MANNNDNAVLTHNSYASAMADLKARKGAAGVARWSAGEGYVAEGQWDARVKRVVIRTWNPDGSRCA